MSPERHEPEHPSQAHRIAAVTILVVAVLTALLLFSVRHSPAEGRAYELRSHSFPPDPEPVLLPAPPVDDEYFPCDDCHEGEPANPTERELDEHDHIELTHGTLWCLDCHDTDKRDSLHLTNHRLVVFEESWRLCTRCHGNKLDDWKAGIHGKRTGYWRGQKQYRTCVVCHDPHAPRFKPLQPRPRPRRAIEIRLPARLVREETPDEGR